MGWDEGESLSLFQEDVSDQSRVLLVCTPFLRVTPYAPNSYKGTMSIFLNIENKHARYQYHENIVKRGICDGE